MPALTPEAVAGLWQEVARRHRLQLIPKDEAREMRDLAWFLDLIGVMDRDRFLSRYTTTLADRVYLSFELGVEGSGGRSLLSQVRTCGHELRHVNQWGEGGWSFALEYMADRSRRAFYEMEALQVSQAIHHGLTGDMLDPDRQATILADYRCSEEDIAFVSKGLRTSAEVIKAGGVTRREALEILHILFNRP
jgi:hypothetical protein